MHNISKLRILRIRNFMELVLADWIIIFAFFAISLFIGMYFTKSGGKDLDSYFLGGRNLPWWVAGTSMVATTFAADTPLAVTELVALNGIAGNWLWWNMLLGGLLTTFFFAKYWRRAEILTDVELIEIRYSGKAAAFLRGFRALYMGLFMNALVIGWVNIALMSILKVFFGIEDSQLIWYVAGAMLLVVVYSSLSGLMGVAYTDMIQFAIAMTGCIILAIIVVNSEKIGGISGLKEKLPEGSLNFFPNIGETNGVKSLGLGIGAFLAFAGVQWWASWYPGAEPGGGGYIAQRMMSCKNEKHALAATLYFQIAHYCLRPWPWIIVGLCSLVLYPDLPDADKKLGYVMAMKDFLPNGLKGLLLVAFLAAYMSTISTQLNWGCSYIVNDFYKRFLAKPGTTDKQFVSISRIATVATMLISLYATTQITSISGVWSFIIECGAGLGLVLILRWYWWRINAWSEISATIAPFIGYAISRYLFNWEFPDSFFFTVGFTTVSWITITYITSPTDNAVLQSFYDKIKPDGYWGKYKTTTTQSNLPALAGCWLLSIIFTYSLLFLIGELLFMNYTNIVIYTSTTVISFIGLYMLSQKTKIFE